ncbi:hypothetical protein PCANC_21751 [Puccinia coronata f. sp. avenae]|uniref:Uncharacterized protein n=1 Tax=Puccinia coronata f. sp. avenae TaxID=200324 RepID=A0A2N5SKF3_9BASI|nr:hypothetical protein PCANC_21751 [Puccinia coronata f. sp. avenae]
MEWHWHASAINSALPPAPGGGVTTHKGNQLVCTATAAGSIGLIRDSASFKP